MSMSAAQLIATAPTVARDPEVEARVAYVRLAHPHGAACKATGDVAAWLSACYALTPRVERVSAEAALLDLGRCTSEEALAAVRELLERLRAHGRHAVAGVGPSMTLAQLAVIGSSFPRGKGSQGVRFIRLIATADAPAFLRGVPVTALAALHGHDGVTSEVVERLRHYGLRTLGHLARLGEPALRRQFGKTGAFLAAVAAGRDERPLQTTARSPRQHFRLRFPAGASVERVLAILPRFARRVMARLRRRQRAGRTLQLSVRCESGRLGHMRLTLRRPTGDARTLAQEIHRMLDALLPAASRGEREDSAIEELRLTVGDFALAVPEQMTLWRMRAQQRVVVETVAETLARRHGRPLVLAANCAAPAAVFAEDRYQFSALSTPTEQAPVSGGARMRETGDTPWRQVPQRLHWW
jgi:nucleotidyltransferase/DNA polymerase involved in DNA repair